MPRTGHRPHALAGIACSKPTSAPNAEEEAMKTLLVSVSSFGVGVSIAVAQTPGGSMYSSAPLGYSDSSRCNTVELKPGESPPLVTPIAGLPNARNKKSAEAPRAIPTPSLADGSKVMTDTKGGCTIYRNKAQ
jgi:hypothetical protein